jgi:predicted nuclease of predicted toxin-antitoxin system
MATIKFYFDEHMPRTAAKALIAQKIEVIMAIDSEMIGKDDDAEHLPFAAQLQAVVVTRDFPFAGRTAKHTNHAGLICWTGAQDDIGGIVRALSQFAENHSAEQAQGQVFWLR